MATLLGHSNSPTDTANESLAAAAGKDILPTSSTNETGGPSKFFLEALQQASRLRRSSSSAKGYSGDASSTPASPSASGSTCGYSSTVTESASSSCPPQDDRTPVATDSTAVVSADSGITYDKGGSEAASSSVCSVPATADPIQTPARPKGPPPSGRPRSAMAAMAGAAKAKAEQGDASSHDLLHSKEESNADGGSRNSSKGRVRDATPEGKSSQGLKGGSREFVDPRLERLHFMQAVQRMRSQVAADQSNIHADDLAHKINTEILAGRPQRPQSAVARLQPSACGE